MKKILSLLLVGVMALSMIPTAMAADVDVQQGTQVTVVGTGGEYTVTVPATLTPGQTGTVTAKGYWASNETLKVSTPATVEVTDGTQKTNINISFAGIESAGSDLDEMNIPVDISIDDGGIKFGEWTGTIIYNVELAEVQLQTFTVSKSSSSGSPTVYTYQYEDGMTWADFMESNLSKGEFKLTQDGKVCTTVFGGYYGLKEDGNAVSPDSLISPVEYTV